MKKIGFIIDNTTVVDVIDKQELNVAGIFNLHTYTEDNKELGNEIKGVNNFYEYLRDNNQFGRTAASSIGEISDVIEKGLEQYEKLIVLVLSSKLSSTYNNAVLAANNYNDKVSVIDTKSVVGATYHLLQRANKMIKNECSFEQIVNELEVLSNKTKTFIVINNFDAIVFNGRIGKAKSQVANLFNIKGIISVDKNGVELFGKVRTLKKALKKVSTYVAENVDSSYEIFSGNILNNEDYKLFIEILKNDSNIDTTQIVVPTIAGVHGGIGLIGISFLEK